MPVSIREYRPDDLPEVERCLAELQDFSKLIYAKAADGAIAPRYLQHLLTRCGETNGQILVAERTAASSAWSPYMRASNPTRSMKKIRIRTSLTW
jgi:hypothetical protein